MRRTLSRRGSNARNLLKLTLIPVRLPYAATRSALARDAGKSDHHGRALVHLLERAPRLAWHPANIRILKDSTNRSAAAVILANIYMEHARR
jgi:hypothetical protein